MAVESTKRTRPSTINNGRRIQVDLNFLVLNVANQSAINAAVQQALSQFKSETAKKLSDLETQAASPDVSQAAGMLMKLFQ